MACKVEIVEELFFNSLFPAIAALNNLANCNYAIALMDNLYGRAMLKNDIDGYLCTLDSIEYFLVAKDFIVLFCINNLVITLTINGAEFEEGD